jgi:hypothetical protein
MFDTLQYVPKKQRKLEVLQKISHQRKMPSLAETQVRLHLFPPSTLATPCYISRGRQLPNHPPLSKSASRKHLQPPHTCRSLHVHVRKQKSKHHAHAARACCLCSS